MGLGPSRRPPPRPARSRAGGTQCARGLALRRTSLPHPPGAGRADHGRARGAGIPRAERGARPVRAEAGGRNNGPQHAARARQAQSRARPARLERARRARAAAGAGPRRGARAGHGTRGLRAARRGLGGRARARGHRLWRLTIPPAARGSRYQRLGLGTERRARPGASLPSARLRQLPGGLRSVRGSLVSDALRPGRRADRPRHPHRAAHASRGTGGFGESVCARPREACFRFISAKARSGSTARPCRSRSSPAAARARSS